MAVAEVLGVVSGYAWFLDDITKFKASTCSLVDVEFVLLEKMFLFLKVKIEGYFILLFHTLYIWITAYVSPLLISFDDFLVCFSLSS